VKTARVKVRITSIREHPDLKGFFDDWDYRQEKLTGVPRHFLGRGYPIPVYGPLPKKGEKGGGD
jgi:hypothetical protein